MKMGVRGGGSVFLCFLFFLGGGCQGGCERKRRIEVIVKIQKQWGRGSGHGGYERRIKVFVKMQKKWGGGSGCRESRWM